MTYKKPRQVFDRYFLAHERRDLLKTVRRVDDVLAKRDLAWMQFDLATGVRVSVLAGMTCDDARQALRENKFTVRGAINKGGRTYHVFLNKQSSRALRSLLSIRRQMGFAEVADEPLILSRRGDGLSVRSFEQRLAEWVKLAGLRRGGSPHWFRHTLAKQIMKTSNAEQPLLMVMTVLGITNINNAAIYAGPDLESVLETMQGVG